MGADNVDDLLLLANTPAQVETRGIDLYVNSHKTKFICFNQDGAISSLNGKPPKLVDHFIDLGSNISFTENEVNISIGKA